MLEFIKMEFPFDLFLTENVRNSFYEDAQPSEMIEATGFYQPPIFQTEA